MTAIDALNLPTPDETTIPTTLWLVIEIEKINNKQTKTLTEILMAHLKNRLDPRRKTRQNSLSKTKKRNSKNSRKLVLPPCSKLLN